MKINSIGACNSYALQQKNQKNVSFGLYDENKERTLKLIGKSATDEQKKYLDTFEAMTIRSNEDGEVWADVHDKRYSLIFFPFENLQKEDYFGAMWDHIERKNWEIAHPVEAAKRRAADMVDGTKYPPREKKDIFDRMAEYDSMGYKLW